MAFRYYHILIPLMILSACASIEDCQNDPNKDFLLIGFTPPTGSTIRFDSIYIDGFFAVGDTDRIVALAPYLDPENETMNLVFFTDSIDYTLNLQYETQVQIYEVDCPVSYSFYNLDTISTTFDSVVITNTKLLYTSGYDLTIYF